MACASLLTDDNILRFRTKACLRLLQGSCSFGDDRCQYSHSPVWTRRSPYYASPSSRRERSEETEREPLLRYLPVPCENLQLENGKVVKVKCPRGISCPFSHSTEEIAYHPLIYKTEPCKAFAQRSCRVYYCWKSHGEKERRHHPRYASLGVAKGLDAPLNYPGVSLVELMPNKNGRRRRQRLTLANSTMTALETSGSRGSTASAENGSHEKVDLLLKDLVQHLADSSPGYDSSLPRDALWELGGNHPVKPILPHSAEDAKGNWPPLRSLLHVLEGRINAQCCAEDDGAALSFPPHPVHSLKQHANQTGKKPQSCVLSHNTPLDSSTDHMQMRRPAVYTENYEALGWALPNLKHQLDGNPVASWDIKARIEGLSNLTGSFAAPANFSQLVRSQHLGIQAPMHAGLYRWCSGLGPKDGVPFDGAYKDHRRKSMPLRCVQSSPAASPDMKQRLCKLEQESLEELKVGTVEHEDSPCTRLTGGDCGSLASTCFSLEFSPTGSNWSCSKCDMEHSIGPVYKGDEEVHLEQIQMDNEPSSSWGRTCRSEKIVEYLPEMEAREEETVPLKDMHGPSQELGSHDEAEVNKKLMSCVVSLLKMIQEKESIDVKVGGQRRGECMSTNAECGVRESPQPADDTTIASGSQNMAASWNMARLVA
ncbi:zinc finger (ccch type) domain-containing protein [Cyclospora cayetanensis]|uniref:Zinc finger (Ccch type) domain-containing protein n=1 Tax=Cyclospora cayetanensis TaxID=88456 RepID=A0A1D3CV49_9EIME|nr:zinc finger (ccch type) domain-containing protein [Cyclospora cayetanensis]